jgi:hypothetical protein
VYAYLRLEQRQWQQIPPLKIRFQAGRRVLSYTSFNLGLTLILGMIGYFPTWLFLPYALQWTESIWGSLNPAIGVKPNRIGLRQLVVSSLFTLLFIFCWRI